MPKQKLGRNPLNKLKARQSASYLQSAQPNRKMKGDWAALDKIKELKIQIDWVQFYDQAVPKSLKTLTKRFMSK